jgi:hypothetical protein
MDSAAQLFVKHPLSQMMIKNPVIAYSDHELDELPSRCNPAATTDARDL